MLGHRLRKVRVRLRHLPEEIGSGGSRARYLCRNRLSPHGVAECVPADILSPFG